MSRPSSGPRVGVYGYFGMGNIGNEASLAAFLEALARHRPDASVTGFVAGPELVEEEHGIDAVRLMWHRGDPAAARLPETVRKLVGRAVDAPRTWWMMREVDVLVVPGTGILESQLMARPWGMPYWLLLATLACRVRGRPVALVGVGAEPARHRVTRVLLAATVRLVTVTSVRDDASRTVVEGWGASGPVRVVPDLAFALPVPDGGPARPGHVVVGVMAYAGDPADPARGPGVVGAYTVRMTEAVARLVSDGGTVTLVVGDLADLPLAEDIRRSVAHRRPVAADRVLVSRAATLADLMVEMAEAEATVVSRFHNLVGSLKVGTPAVSLSYAAKNARLLGEVGLEDLVQPIDDFDVDRLVEQVELAAGARDSLGVVMKEAAGRFAESLDDHVRELVAQVVAAPARVRGVPWRRGRRPRGVLRPRRR